MAILHVNIIPYQRLLAGVASVIPFGSNHGLGFLTGLPVIKDIIKVFGDTLIYFFGAIAFVLVQGLELLPKFIYRIPGVLKGVIAEPGKDYPIKEGDSRTVRKVKNKLNQGYLWALAYVDSLSFWTYIFDFIVCLLVYPPITGTKNPLDALGAIFTVLYYQEWQRISWLNLLLLGFTVYGVERSLDAIFATNDLFAAYRRGKE